MSAFDYKVHYTGSSGNSVEINVKGGDYSLTVDIGKPYKHLEQHLEKSSFVFISHRHS